MAERVPDKLVEQAVAVLWADDSSSPPLVVVNDARAVLTTVWPLVQELMDAARQERDASLQLIRLHTFAVGPLSAHTLDIAQETHRVSLGRLAHALRALREACDE